MNKSELKFGISLIDEMERYIDAMKIIDISLFDLIELPGGYLDARRERNSFDSTNDIFSAFDENKRRFKVISVSDIATANIAGEMSEQSTKIQNDFVEKIRAAIVNLTELNITQCTLNISPENSFANPEKRKNKVKLLKKIGPLLIENGITVSLPVRIPAAIGIDFTQYPAFLRETMCPNIKLALNIHPHEIKDKHEPLDQLKPFRFLMDSISFVYEPDSGNFLVEKLLKPWFEILEKFQFSKPVFFVPRTASIANLGREIARLSDLVKKYQAKMGKELIS